LAVLEFDFLFGGVNVYIDLGRVYGDEDQCLGIPTFHQTLTVTFHDGFCHKPIFDIPAVDINEQTVGPLPLAKSAGAACVLIWRSSCRVSPLSMDWPVVLPMRWEEAQWDLKMREDEEFLFRLLPGGKEMLENGMAALKTVSTIWFISVRGVFRNFRRAGILKKRFFISTMVPGGRPLPRWPAVFHRKF
jgi:hypothetical protein